MSAQQRTDKYKIYTLWFDPTGSQTTIYSIRYEHANHYDTDTVQKLEMETFWKSIL
jgi:hypothetical protein